tara:strand:- start:1783 stop:2004 length:222 start_codon:yes stop_codon:yes gene_type:complete
MITEQDIIVDNLIKEAVDILNNNVTIKELVAEDKQRMLELLDDADIKEPYATIFVDHWIKKTFSLMKTVKEAS